MQRRNNSSILPYGFGLALALSLLFNGFLLHEQSRRFSPDPDEPGSLVRLEGRAWQRQLSDCQRANEHKDSLIHQLTQATNAPPAPATVAHRGSPP